MLSMLLIATSGYLIGEAIATYLEYKLLKGELEWK